ncbi:MAG: hypothetical protein A3E87_07965 [Gammaproteobacteria bacterium RIFCSPHIGHO2_12_FULL_35_23]|nr:MAG: hypothetical protein A3E87_07965 [Gammaproteobacteria bacterium RIFCSPHIGHO2_12_FULL_35_23]
MSDYQILSTAEILRLLNPTALQHEVRPRATSGGAAHIASPGTSSSQPSSLSSPPRTSVVSSASPPTPKRAKGPS